MKVKYGDIPQFSWYKKTKTNNEMILLKNICVSKAC